jgi:hypothetical protein
MNTLTIPNPTHAPTPAAQRDASSPGSVVALATTITQDRVDGEVDILAISQSVELTDSPRGVGWLVPGELDDSERVMLNDELAAYTSRYARGAVVLERLIDRGAGEIVHLEARLVPLAQDERNDLEDFLGDSDRELGEEMARAYAADLHSAWAANPDLPPVQVCFLEDIGRLTTSPWGLTATPDLTRLDPRCGGVLKETPYGSQRPARQRRAQKAPHHRPRHPRGRR